MSFRFDSFKDGVDLKEDGRIAVNRDGGPNGSYEIVIKKVKSSDAGSYTAAASNSFGTEECVAAVTVKGSFSFLFGYYCSSFSNFLILFRC